MTLQAAVQLERGVLAMDVSLVARRGEVVVVLGPNGAGKSTLLRALAGLERLRSGRVELDGVVLEDAATGVRVAADRRPIGLVPQDYLLFPHLSVADNVAFGLRARGQGRRAARAAALDWLATVDLSHYAGQRPAALSGGQAQRVALARALAIRPGLLLLDEPLAAVDVLQRAGLRRHLRRTLQDAPVASLFVTHDPVEAMAIGDRLVIIEEGRVVQEGTATDIARAPRSRYVAELVGLNFYHGTGHDGTVRLEEGGSLAAMHIEEGDVFAVVHPRAVAIHRTRPEGSPRNVWQGPVEAIEPLQDRVRVLVAGAPPVLAEITPAALQALDLRAGDPVWVSVKAAEVDVYPR